MIFNRKYEHGLELMVFLSLHEERVDIAISHEGQCVASFSARADRMAITEEAIFFFQGERELAAAWTAPYPRLCVTTDEDRNA